jgi:hypothetical protein
MKALKVLKYVGFGILGVGFIFLVLWLIMLLWNALIPELFNGPVLSYWQAAGLFILSKILFSGMGSGGSKHKSSFSKHSWKSKYHSKYSGKDESTGEAEVVVE